MRYLSASPVVVPARRGVVLLVVMAMLALFAALGISFVFYADAVAVAANANRAAAAKDQAYIDPELLQSYLLAKLLYGEDPNNNPYSSMLGHSLAETMWGNNPMTLNYTPYNGPGRQSYQVASVGNLDNFNLIQYMKHDNDGFQRRPGFTDVVGSPQFALGYREGTNVPWTAPDRHNMFLAMMTADGTVLTPSFMRPWIDPQVASSAGTAKYLTLRPHGSYHPGFVPNAPFGSAIPYLPDSETITINGKPIILDVRNNDFGVGFLGPAGVIYNNDSIWMDLGFPIMTAQNGKRYRPLFAPLVVDLSNRLHLWAHGNNIGTGGAHVSGQGWGASEVNLGKVITDPTDLAKVFLPPPAGLRGAPNSLPFGLNGLAGAAPLPNSPWAAPIDFDAKDNTTGLSVAPFTLPGVGSAGKMFSFPSYPASGYENNAAEYAAGMPLGRNIFAANGKPLPMSEMEWLLRYGGTNVPATPSELAKRLTNTFNDPLRRNRNMLTLWSAHLDRIAASPVISFDPYDFDGTTTFARYTMGLPTGTPALSPPPKLNPPLTPIAYSPPPASVGIPNSEYAAAANWRSNLANRLRINVNRKLTSYPLPDATTGLITDTAVYNQAVLDRQMLAQEIYQALVLVTGAVDPNHPSASAVAKDPTTASYKAVRWLAQLAVNMVDYIDEDDYFTPFQWDPIANPNEWVFGTELPRLVINEFYGQLDNFDPNDMTPADSKLNLWLELHNPFQATPAGAAYPRDGGAANLVQGGDATKPIYKIVICLPETAMTKKLRDPENNLGEPDPTLVLSTVSDWGPAGANQTVLPSNGAFADTAKKNNGFYIIGPQATFLPDRNPTLPTTYLTANGPSTGLSITRKSIDPIPRVTVLLRRLANPHLPFNNTPGIGYNPYITVDYLTDMTSFENRTYDQDGDRMNMFFPVSLRALGRGQPYTANTNQIFIQNPIEYDPDGTQPKHTFFRHNSRSDAPPVGPPFAKDQTLTFPFDWLTHLDRPLVNPLELLHVSGFKPHELTQQFMTVNSGTAGRFQHLAPWDVQESMIYRVLDLLMTPNHLAGTYRGGIHPGILNPNTITEREIFQALADPNNANFTAADVDAVFAKVVQSRTSNPAGTFPAAMQPTSDGNPFRALSAGDKETSWLRFDPTNPTTTTDKVFDLGSSTDHPYKRKALLQKIYNNLTPTSNVFAVWWTVGYFEVFEYEVDGNLNPIVPLKAIRPAKIGAEIGRSENRHIRHRFFAIVDRSAMKIYSSTVSAAAPGGGGLPVAGTLNPLAVSTKTTGAASPWGATQNYANSNAVIAPNGAAYICIQPNIGQEPSVSPGFWQTALQPGMILEIGGANPEAVVVKMVTGNGFTADFQFVHNNDPMILRGNPGPQATYNPHRDNSVILHMSVIK